MTNIQDIFGSMVFNEAVMQAKLPKDIFKAAKRSMTQGKHLDIEVANVVANAMKDWAIEKGVTHFSHWFHPMTGITAEKHDSFIEPSGDGRALMEFSGKALVKGEPDASSFPSGGLRATFEARGYTVWDVTSYAFIKDGTLYIPTVFFSYSGEALDEKTPLLRSMEALNLQALRILKLFGNDAKRVTPMVGPEQEYFLVDKRVYSKRPDLYYTGRTLFGARPPKGQELEDHYLGSIKPRVAAYMQELEQELWRLGIYAKTKHNETAPAQHELAVVYNTTNISTDHNQITMNLMKTIAARHDLVCLLHEKPFQGVNGSGKHNNWSLATDAGDNLLEPGETPHENAQFLLFLMAMIKAVDEHQDLIRASAAKAGNDHRLGAHEAPPAIVSMFLGDELTAILEAIDSGADYKGKAQSAMAVGVTALPHFPKDTTDRNRTSPFAYTGNKFEFRMLGSSFSIAEPNIVINTIMAESLRQFADRLEYSRQFNEDLSRLLKETFRNHKRIIYNGNNYSEAWVAEAAQRGLLNLPTTADALEALVSPKNIELYSRHGVVTADELASRHDIFLENYCKTIHIEGYTMASIVKRSIVPACVDYQRELMELVRAKGIYNRCAPNRYASNDLRLSDDLHSSGEIHPSVDIYSSEMEQGILSKISALCGDMYKKLVHLESALDTITEANPGELTAQAAHYNTQVLPAMAELRTSVDELERIAARKYWPLPSYGELLHSV